MRATASGEELDALATLIRIHPHGDRAALVGKYPYDGAIEKDMQLERLIIGERKRCSVYRSATAPTDGSRVNNEDPVLCPVVRHRQGRIAVRRAEQLHTALTSYSQYIGNVTCHFSVDKHSRDARPGG